jgi:hypothetical protein
MYDLSFSHNIISQRHSVANYWWRSQLADSGHPDDGGARFTQNVGFCESDTG